MENFTLKDYDILIELVERKMASILKGTYSDDELHGEYVDLEIILIRLNAQLSILSRM